MDYPSNGAIGIYDSMYLFYAIALYNIIFVLPILPMHKILIKCIFNFCK